MCCNNKRKIKRQIDMKGKINVGKCQRGKGMETAFKLTNTRNNGKVMQR